MELHQDSSSNDKSSKLKFKSIKKFCRALYLMIDGKDLYSPQEFINKKYASIHILIFSSNLLFLFFVIF